MQKEIDLKVLFIVIRKRMLLILIISGIATVLGGVYSLLTTAPPPIYQSSASILLNSNTDDGANTFEVILRDSMVLKDVITELGLSISIKEVNDQIDFFNDGGKIVRITASDENPELAANIANTTANVFIKQLGSALGIYDARIFSEANPSNNPISMDTGSSIIKFLVLGFGSGLVLAIGLVLFIDSLDDTIKSEREIEKLLDVPVIGSISKMDKRNIKDKAGQRKGSKKRGANYGA